MCLDWGGRCCRGDFILGQPLKGLFKNGNPTGAFGLTYECVRLLGLPFQSTTQTRCINNRNLFITDLEVAYPKSRCHQDWFSLRALKKGSVPGLFAWLADNPYLSASSRGRFSVHMNPDVSSSSYDTSHRGLGSLPSSLI